MWRGMKLPPSMCRSADFVDCLIVILNPHETPKRLALSFDVVSTTGARPSGRVQCNSVPRLVILQRLESTRVEQVRVSNQPLNDVAAPPNSAGPRGVQHGSRRGAHDPCAGERCMGDARVHLE